MNILKKRSIFHSFFLVLSILSLLLLVACDDISAEDMENYPESVQDGTVSVEYYKQIESFYEEDFSLSESIVNILESQVEIGSRTVEKNPDLETAIEMFNKNLDGYTKKPSTKADKDIDFQFEKVIYMQQEINELELGLLRGDRLDGIEASVLIGLVRKVFQDFDDVVENYEIK